MFWFIRRLLLSIVLLWLVFTVVFLSIYMVPGDPVQLLLSGDAGAADNAAVEALRAKLGLDRPIYIQYADRLLGLFRLDLGNSLVSNAPIINDIASRLPRTLELIAAAAVISLLIGLPAGVMAALRRGRAFDRAASSVTGFAQSVPVFVIGTLLVLVMAQMLRLVPAGGYIEFTEDPVRHMILLLMPATAISVGLAATVFRITRSSVLEVIPLDYVRTARAKGISRNRVTTRHILRNALMPVVTVFALSLGSLLSGTLLVEFVFNWPGLSSMLIRAVNARDYTSVTGVLLVTAALFILINLVVDIIYAVLDPRVRR